MEQKIESDDFDAQKILSNPALLYLYLTDSELSKRLIREVPNLEEGLLKIIANEHKGMHSSMIDILGKNLPHEIQNYIHENPNHHEQMYDNIPFSHMSDKVKKAYEKNIREKLEHHKDSHIMVKQKFLNQLEDLNSHLKK